MKYQNESPEDDNDHEDNKLSEIWLTQQEAADKMRVSVSTIKTYRRKKGLRYTKIDGRVRINEDDIQSFWMKHRR